MKQIFILGVSRTGSKFYTQLLNTHKDIFVSPELMFRHPIKKNFYTLLESSIKSGDSIEKIVDKLFEFKERLPFTKTINKIGKEILINELSLLKKLTPYSIFDCIVRLSANKENKVIYGAKFPVHYMYSEALANYFLDSKILYLTRDPRAIYASDLKKKKKESKGNYYRFRVKYFISFFVLLYTIFEWKMSLKSYEKCLTRYGEDRIRLMKYENVVIDNNMVIREIADFLKVSPNDFNIENVLIVDSSFENGISADRWRTNISSIEKFVFKVLISRKMKKYGYV